VHVRSAPVEVTGALLHSDDCVNASRRNSPVTRFLGSWWLRGAIAAVAIVLIAAVALDRTGSDDEPPQAVDALPAQTLTPETGQAVDPQIQAAAERVAAEFVAAANAGDIDALYNLQQSEYREACNRADFETVLRPFLGTKLEGPTEVEVRGREAAANLTRRVEGGPNVALVLPLVLDVDGTWRVKAPAVGGCRP
jgi:hypothetical protein